MQFGRIPNTGPKPISNGQAEEMAQNGRRLFETFKAVDNTPVDKNPEEGKVELDIGRAGQVAEFSGDIYEGSLAINREARHGKFLSRRYEFSNNDLTITDHLPTFHKEEMNVYRIKNGYAGTVEHIVRD